MNVSQAVFLMFLVFLGITCGPKNITIQGNPSAEGFNLTESDEVAMKIADEVMEAMGGRRAWDTTRYISWTFFGRRHHTWDKQDHKVRIEIPGQQLTMIVDLKEKTGLVEKNNEQFTNPDSLALYVEQGYRAWINDSYWLVMPFKLKDSGVTLKYVKKDTTTLGLSSDVLQLTFSDIGVTPENKYWVYIDDQSRLVTQWDYFANYQDSIPRFQSPWPNYKSYGDLLLSGGQIGGNTLTDIRVFQNTDENLFSQL